MLRCEAFEYQDQDYHVKIVVGVATVQDGFVRQALMGKMQALCDKEAPLKPRQAGQELGPEDYTISLAKRNALVGTYTAIRAGTLEVENLDGAAEKVHWELGHEDFLNLPESLVKAWEDEVYRRNPHWSPFFQLQRRESAKSDETGSGKT